MSISSPSTIPAPAPPAPIAPLRGLTAYAPPPRPAHIDLRLDANERALAPEDMATLLAALTPDDICRYPDTAPLTALLATQLSVDADRILITAGADDAIDRTMRAYLSDTSQLLTTSPTFEMIPRSARLTGAQVIEIPWTSGPFPISDLVSALTDATAMIAIVSPNNPTGAIVTADDLRALSAAAPGAILLVDLAYTEYADLDLTAVATKLPNTIIIRTLSKAWGLAGLRIGYSIASPEITQTLRAAGGPYAASSASLTIAQRALTTLAPQAAQHISATRRIRESLSASLDFLSIKCPPSQGNFLLPEFPDAAWTADALASLGIAVRRFSSSVLRRRMRITCPDNPADAQRLTRALRAALAPQALLFDMDGVLADVSLSYRAAIIQTAATYAVTLTPADIAAAKSIGDANNDWVLTKRLLAARGVDASLSEVTARFEALYHGDPTRPGLRETESLIPSLETLRALATRLPLAIVTGRPRADCDRFLARFNLTDLFPVRICMEDAPAKPSPAPVLRALEALNIDAAWLIGDTPDDILAARRAGVIPIGFTPPNITPLTLNSAARTLSNLTEILDLLP